MRRDLHLINRPCGYLLALKNHPKHAAKKGTALARTVVRRGEWY